MPVIGQTSLGVVTATGVMVWPGWVGVMNWFMMTLTLASLQVGQVPPHNIRAVGSDSDSADATPAPFMTGTPECDCQRSDATYVSRLRPQRLGIEGICDSRKFVSKHAYPVTEPDPPMCEVERVGCEILRGCPLIGRLLLRGW